MPARTWSGCALPSAVCWCLAFFEIIQWRQSRDCLASAGSGGLSGGRDECPSGQGRCRLAARQAARLAWRRLRPLYPLAILPGEMPLLRFQLPCLACGGPWRMAPCAAGRDAPYAGADRAAAGRYGVLRRRHAQPDGTGHGGGPDRRGRGLVGAGGGGRDQPRSQPDQRRGREVPRLCGGWGQPAIDGGAGAERCRPEGAGADAYSGRGGSGVCGRAGCLRAGPHRRSRRCRAGRGRGRSTSRRGEAWP